MAYDEAEAAAIRDRLEGLPGIGEKRMFGGLCFLLDGNMLCGVHGAKTGGGAMFRVAPEAEAEALAIPGVRPMRMTGRRMRGFVDAGPELLADGGRLGTLIALALAYVGAMPPK